MNHKLTRRAIVKLLAAAPVALALPELTLAAEVKRPAGPPLTEKEKRSIAKGQADLKKAMAALHKMAVPMGTEPAFVFSPVVKKP